MNTSKNIVAAAIGFFIGAAGVQEVLAQDKAVGGNNNLLKLEEIVVTATKKGRAENVQDVPAAITVMNEEQLSGVFLDNLIDIGSRIPNVSFDSVGTIPGQASFFIRGAGVNSSNAGLDPAVGVVIDGMFVANPAGQLTEPFDLESIEVLRGPQGTLFGRNVTGGVIVMRSKRPTGEFDAKIKATLGAYGRNDFAFVIEDALIEDKLAAKIDLRYKDHEGYFHNPSEHGDRVGDSRTKIVRTLFKYTPSEQLEVDLILEHGEQKSDGALTQVLFDPPTLTGIFGDPSRDIDELNHDNTDPVKQRWTNAIVELNWELADGLLTSVSTYRDYAMPEMGGDLDGTPADVLSIGDGSNTKQHQFSQELRYATSINDRIDITSGIYYFTQSLDNAISVNIVRIPAEAVGASYKGSLRYDHQTIGLFSQADISLSDNWMLTLGGRYTREEKEIKMAPRGGCDFLTFECNYSFVDDETWGNFSYKAGLQWMISDNSQVYASLSRGYRSGGYNFNATVTQNPGPFDEERIDSFELGFKADIGDRIRINGAFFINQFDDLQRQVLLPDPATGTLLSGISNAGEAEILGFESELVYIVNDNFSINASFGHMSTEIDEFEGLDVDGDGAVTDTDASLVKDLELARVPMRTYSLGVNYNFPFDNGARVVFRSDYSYKRQRAVDDINSFNLDAQRLLNASVSYYSAEEKFQLSLFGKNLQDNVVGTMGAFINGFIKNLSLAPPRTWGVEATYHF